MSEIEILHHRFCQYSEVFKGNTKATIRWLKSEFRSFLKFSDVQSLKQVDRTVIEDWILKGKIEHNWAAKTVKTRLQAMSLFLDWCVRENHIKGNCIHDIPKPKLPTRIPKNLSKEQAMHLLDWTRNYPYNYNFERTRAIAIIATFIYTGVRKEELRNLRWQDIDLVNKTLFVFNGKGDKDRIVPLHQNLIFILEQYLKDRRRLNKCCPYFFTAMRQDSRMGDSVVKRLILKLRNKSKINFHPHILRHTFATLMLDGGCNLYALSKMLGHSDIKTTTIYLSASKAHLQEQIEMHPLTF
jgi:site-specific recombinase XerD